MDSLQAQRERQKQMRLQIQMEMDQMQLPPREYRLQPQQQQEYQLQQYQQEYQPTSNKPYASQDLYSSNQQQYSSQQQQFSSHQSQPRFMIQQEDDFEDAPLEGSRTLAIVACLFASLGGIFFGYDQGVTGGVFVMDSFLQDFCVGYHDLTLQDCKMDPKNLPDVWTSFTTLYNAIYHIGCILGAIIGGIIADRFGRRGTIFAAGLFFCLGTSVLCLAPHGDTTRVLIARVIQGFGVGNSSFSLPIFGAEVSPKELRGFLSGFMQMMIVTGILLSNFVNLIVEDHSNGWRTTNAVAMVAPAVVMAGIFFLPESPRWVYLHKGMNAAEAVLKRLRQTENVSRELRAIGRQVARDGGLESEWSDLLAPSIFTRVLIAMFLQAGVQATGINPVFLYGPLIFRDVVHKATLSVFFLAIVNFLSTIPAMRWVDTVGRRQLLLIGVVGMVFGHLVSAIIFTIGCRGDTEKTDCSSFSGYFMLVATAFFVFNFAISWGPIGWIYPPEIFPLGVRAKAVSLSTMANWAMGAVMSFVVKGFKYLNINGVFFLFAFLCLGCGAFAYYFCPETKGILLEDIEQLFQRSTQTNTNSKYYSSEQTPTQDVI